MQATVVLCYDWLVSDLQDDKRNGVNGISIKVWSLSVYEWGGERWIDWRTEGLLQHFLKVEIKKGWISIGATPSKWLNGTDSIRQVVQGGFSFKWGILFIAVINTKN